MNIYFSARVIGTRISFSTTKISYWTTLSTYLFVHNIFLHPFSNYNRPEYGAKIYQLHPLQKSKTTTPKEYLGYDNKLYIRVKFQFWGSVITSVKWLFNWFWYEITQQGFLRTIKLTNQTNYGLWFNFECLCTHFINQFIRLIDWVGFLRKTDSSQESLTFMAQSDGLQNTPNASL